jgi:hypothetical protein
MPKIIAEKTKVTESLKCPNCKKPVMVHIESYYSLNGVVVGTYSKARVKCLACSSLVEFEKKDLEAL